MTKEKAMEIVRQVLHNPQVSHPPTSYSITDKSGSEYSSDYIDLRDFVTYLKRLEKQLERRFSSET